MSGKKDGYAKKSLPWTRCATQAGGERDSILRDQVALGKQTKDKKNLTRRNAGKDQSRPELEAGIPTEKPCKGGTQQSL